MKRQRLPFVDIILAALIVGMAVFIVWWALGLVG